MVQEIAVRQALTQCLRGSFEFVVKTAFLDWEAAVLPLNYARERLSCLSGTSQAPITS
jgi:hypothetical protein